MRERMTGVGANHRKIDFAGEPMIHGPSANSDSPPQPQGCCRETSGEDTGPPRHANRGELDIGGGDPRLDITIRTLEEVALRTGLIFQQSGLHIINRDFQVPLVRHHRYT